MHSALVAHTHAHAGASVAIEPLGVESDAFSDVEQEPFAAAGRTPATRDLISAFTTDVSRVRMLTREDEEALGLEIAVQRRRILTLLRGHRRLVAAALRDVGRGLVHPDADFREREALTVLTYANQLVAACSVLLSQSCHCWAVYRAGAG
jgi:hypothetical protein